MNDLISRKDALSLLTVFTEKDALGSTPAVIIKHMPCVDPVVHGKWVFSENDDMFYCTNCKNGSVRNDYPYCHWCGAVMDGEKVTNNEQTNLCGCTNRKFKE